MYLWHWPLLAMARGYSMDPPSLSVKLALCGVAFILAALSYRYVETPFRRSQVPKVRMIGAGVATCAVLALFAGGVGATIRSDDLAARTAKDFPSTTKLCHAEITDPARLPPAACGTGDVVLWGDSHANAWRPYAERFGAVRQFTRGNCPPSAGNEHGWPCQQFNALAATQAKRGRVVILAAYWTSYMGSKREQEASVGIVSALAAVAPHVERVIVLGPTPTMPYTANKCIAKGQLAACTETRADFDRQAAGARALLQAAVARYPNAAYVEPADFFCTATACPLMKDGYSLYWDDNHISSSAARAFGAINYPGSSRARAE
jgi:hypothetical protein